MIARLPASYAVIGDVQWLPGYCVLLTDDPPRRGSPTSTDDARAAYLDSMARLAAAVENVCSARDPAFRRVNVEILGNTDPFLHAHVWPRFDWEPPELVGKPVWLYPSTHWSDPAHALGAEHDGLRAALAEELARG